MTQDYMLPGNFTPREYYRIHDRLEPAHIECLLDTAESATDVPDGRAYIQEARAGLPQEDVLYEALRELRDLAKHVRGDNKVNAEFIIRKLEEAQCELNAAADDARDNLNKAEQELDDYFK